MDSFERFINNLLELLIALGGVILQVLVAIEIWLRGQLTVLGINPAIQTLIMIAVAVALIVGSLRFFGGLLRIGLVLVLLLIAIHIAMPALPR
jgi:hypothetical protein